MYALEYYDDGCWIELATFASVYDAMERGEEEELAYSFQVNFRVRLVA